MQRLLILLLFMITASSVAAQTVDNFHIQQYTTDNGLPSNGIKGIQWDERTGFLWIATEAGIVRFNGVDFKSYTNANMPSIASERMLFIVRNNAGKIYLSDQPGNIFLIDKSKPVLWRKSSTNSSINPYIRNYYLLGVSDLFFNKNAGLLTAPSFATGFNKIIGISDTSCLIQNNTTLLYYSISLKEPVALPFEKANIYSIFKINDRYFVSTGNGGTFLLNVADMTLSPVEVFEKDGGLFNLKTSNSLLFWQTGMSYPVFIDGEKAWLLTYSGGKITAKLIFTGIPAGTYIRSVQYSEKNQLLFIGTESKGLIVINQNRVQSKRRNDVHSKNRNSYYSQIELSNGNILTNESDIIGDNTKDPDILPVKGKFSFNITHTSGQFLWYTQLNKNLGYHCLHQYNKATGLTKVYPKIKWGDIVAESGGKIYLANLLGIGILEEDSIRLLHRYAKDLAGVVTFDFTELSPGNLAVATCSGLLRFNIVTNRLDTLFTKENICVRNIWKYKDYVFFGTYGSGYYIMKGGIFKPMPLDKNKYLLYTHCFMADTNDFCWISTNRGLFKCSLAEITNAFDNNKTAVYYHYFGKKDGMEMTELNGGCTPCALRLSNNHISFPTMDGLLWVNPEKAIPILPDGEIFIDEILADNIAVNADSLQYNSLPAQTQEVIIELGFSAWCNKENIYLDYQLNDLPAWKTVKTDNETFIRLGGLQSGTYRLRIRKLNGFGKDNYSYKLIEFKVATPWYKQWWFYALCLLALLGIIQLIFYIRTRQYKIRQRKLEKQVAEKTKELQEQNEILEKNNTIKTRLISIISHDIVTPLKFVTVAGKKLIEKRNLMTEELQDETIKEMTNTAQELQLLSTNILNWIKYQNENRRLTKETFNVHELVNQVLGVLNSLANQKKLKLINKTDHNLEIHQFFEPLKILIYNLLTNAINFSEKGDIIVAARLEKEHVVISVQDEGVGMTPEQIKNIMADQFIISSANIDNRKGNGLGYLIIKDLVKMMDATLQISSVKNKGTIVSIHVPVGKN
ncbi:MAG: HAMP domain-containing sensor histidine kinase [Ferruginibacter sp.]